MWVYPMLQVGILFSNFALRIFLYLLQCICIHPLFRLQQIRTPRRSCRAQTDTATSFPSSNAAVVLLLRMPLEALNMGALRRRILVSVSFNIFCLHSRFWLNLFFRQYLLIYQTGARSPSSLSAVTVKLWVSNRLKCYLNPINFCNSATILHFSQVLIKTQNPLCRMR